MKKLLIIILVICLSSCSVINNIIGDNNSYNLIDNLFDASVYDFLDVIKNYHVRDKDINNDVINEEFEDFLYDIVVDAYKDSYVSVHYDFVDYKAYGISKPDVSWGVLDEDTEVNKNDTIDLLNRLHSFDYDSLSCRQQYDYETLEYSFYEDLTRLSCSIDATLLFNSRTDFLSGVIDQLSDFSFYDLESLDDYMILLKDSDRYINDAISYSKKIGIEYDYYLTDYSIDIQLDFIDSFVGGKPNALVSTFNERVDKLDFIDDAKKREYKNNNKEIVEEEIIPAVLDVKEFLNSQKGMTTSEDNRLIRLGDDYALGIFLCDISSNKDIDTIFEDSCIVLVNLINELIPLLNDDTVLYDLDRIRNGEVKPLDGDFIDMLEFLENNYTLTHPDLGYINYDLSSIDDSSASSSVIAYYWPSPIDDPRHNIIKYNPHSIDDGEPWEPYFTIAHEGIPGHMYDFYRSLLNEDHAFRRVISYNGVVEGYAKYSEMCAAEYLDIDDKTKRYLAIDSVSGYILDGILDLAINYYDYSDDDLLELINSLGYNVSDVEYFKEFFADTYGALCRYGIGLAMILSLKQNCMDALGSKFNEVEFNDLLTRHGRLPFVIIEDEVNKYIKDNR